MFNGYLLLLCTIFVFQTLWDDFFPFCYQYHSTKQKKHNEYLVNFHLLGIDVNGVSYNDVNIIINIC